MNNKIKTFLKEIGIWTLLLYPSLTLFSATTDYYQPKPSNKLIGLIFDPHTAITASWWADAGWGWMIATFLGIFLTMFSWYLIYKWFKNRPYKTVKVFLVIFYFLLTWSFTGNFAVIKNGYSPFYIHPLRPVRTGYGCMVRHHKFWFFYEQEFWC